LKPQPIAAIVFDFGGVLVDWNPRYLYGKLFDEPSAMEDFFSEVGFMEWNAEQDRRRTFGEGVAEHAEKFPHHAEMIKAFDERWIETVGGEIGETVEILRGLKRAGYPLYGLSNWSAETFGRIRARFAFFELFDLIVLSGEVELIKPDPKIFELLLEKTGRAASACVFIDDAEKNIAAAQALGFRTIRYVSAEAMARELREMGVDWEL
jgi:2-haloacid dehalogenase